MQLPARCWRARHGPPRLCDPVSLNLGIVGLPNVGKSTLFNALTRNNVLAANYPFATIEPNEGVVPLPDPRLDKLAEIFDSEKIVPAPVTFVDIAGIVKGASEGAGLGNKFLANIRECDAICQVVRVFADDDVVHVDGQVDPKSDIEVIETELILADMQTLEKAVPRLEKEARNNKDRKPVHEAAVAAQADARRRHDAVRRRRRYRAAARAEPDDHQAVPLRVQRRRVGAHRRRAQGRAARDWWRPRTRCSSTPRSRPSCRSSTTSRPPSCWSRSARPSAAWMRWRGPVFTR